MDSMLEDQSQNKNSVSHSVIKYTLKILGFLLLVAALPLINVYIIWIMFKMLVLNKNIDVKPLLLAIGSKFKQKHDEDDEIDEEEYDTLTENDVVLLDVEDITNK